MKVTIDTGQWRPSRLYWAWLVRSWPWEICSVRQLLTNPDVTEITVKRADRVTAYCYTKPVERQVSG